MDVPSTYEVRDTELRTISMQVPMGKQGMVTVHLTPTEKVLLKDYLNPTSMNTFLNTLLEAIRDKDEKVRLPRITAKCRGILLEEIVVVTTDPALINALAISLLFKSMAKVKGSKASLLARLRLVPAVINIEAR
eukprot:gene255-336_t